MRRRPHGQFQRGAGGAVPEPWRGRGAAGRGAGAVARNHAGRGSRCDGVQGEGGGAARAVARAPARVARAGREREGREREWRGAGSAARGPGPRVGRRARQGVARIYRGSHSIGGGRFCVLKEICREETLFTALFFRRKYALCGDSQHKLVQRKAGVRQAELPTGTRAGAPRLRLPGCARNAQRGRLSPSDSWTAPWPRGRA